jgi:hypothetical protein
VNKQPHVMYILSCGQVVVSAASYMDKERRLWCPVHNNMSRVTGVHVWEWHMTCRVCHYGRWTGISEETANRLAKAHERATLHRAKVSYERNPVSVEEQLRLKRAKAS